MAQDMNFELQLPVCGKIKMENKTKVIFDYFMEYEDGKIARLKTTEAYNTPFNLFVDNADTIKIKTGECCFVDICGVGNDIEVFDSAMKTLCSRLISCIRERF